MAGLWTTVIQVLSFVGRLGALAASAIVAGLIGHLLSSTDTQLTEFMIYLEVVAGVSILAALVPPYPNFLYDGFFAAAWLLGAGFCLISLYINSECYGYATTTCAFYDPDCRENARVGACAEYKAATAFAFLAFIAYLGMAGFGGILFLMAIFSKARRSMKIGWHNRYAEKEQEAEEFRPPYQWLGETIVRYWVFFGIAGVIAIAVVIPILYFYAVPAFAVYIVGNIDIPDTANATMMEPGNNTLRFDVDTPLRFPAALSGSVGPMNVSFYVVEAGPDASPFAYVPLPKLHFSSGDRLRITNQTLYVGDPAQFAGAMETFANQGSIGLNAKAHAPVNVAGFKTSFDLDYTKFFEGLDAFKYAKINGLKPLEEIDERGNTVAITVEVWNPAPARLDFGTVEADLYIGETYLGSGTLPNANIKPDTNEITVLGRIDIQHVVENVGSILDYEIPFLDRGNIAASVLGKSVVGKGGEPLDGWTEVMRNLNLTVVRPLNEVLAWVLNGTLLEEGGSLGELGGLLDGLTGGNV